MWIEELDNGKFKYVERYKDPYSEKNRKVSVTLNSNTSRASKQAQRILNEKIDKKTKRPSINLTWRELSEEWLEFYKSTNVKLSSYSRAKAQIKALNLYLGDDQIDRLNASRFNNYFLTHLKSERFTYNTMKQLKSMVSRTCDFAKKYKGYDLKEIKENLEVPEINKTKKNPFKYLEKEELKRILDYFEENGFVEFKHIALLLANTGMRYGELTSLREKDIDFQNKSIEVKRTYDRENKVFTAPKTGDERNAYFSNDMAQILYNQIQLSKMITLQYELNKENTLLFKTRFGNPTPMKSFNDELKNADIKGKNVSSHYFRHTFITMAVQNQMDKELIAQQVGHADTSMIDQIYKHFTKDMITQQKEAMLEFKIF